jgi:steroid 5-alpha reductase family enzyme
MVPLENISIIAVVIAISVTILFVVSVAIKRNDVADIAWGIGIFVVALISYFLGPQNLLTPILLLLSALWGFRLSYRILVRFRNKEEDYRYKTWRYTWGKWFYPRSYLQVYILQGFLMMVVGYSFIHASLHGGGYEFGVLSWIGLAVWAIGYFFEVVGDKQLDAFLKDENNKGKVLKSGLWRYSRHPNYFGEVSMWWGIWLMVATTPFGYLALLSPLAITFIILKVSGVPMLEKAMAGNPEFQQYKQETSVFIPLPPKKVEPDYEKSVGE